MKTVIVTGCNRGLGEGLVNKLADKYYNIIMAGRNLNAIK